MRVLIIEPHSSGHHANYLRWLVQAAVLRRWSVVIACTPEALTHPSLRALPGAAGVDVHSISAGSAIASKNLIRRQLGYWWMFRNTVNEVCDKWPVEAIILPYVDYCFYAIAMLGAPFKNLPWCGISMRLAASRDGLQGKSKFPLNWRLARRILRRPNLKSLFVINPSMLHIPSHWLAPGLRSKLAYLPDPAEFESCSAKPAAKTSLGIAESALAILVFGTMDERKGVDSLLTALLNHDELARCVVILAGKQSPSMQDLLGRAPYTQLSSTRRLIVLDRFLDDAEQSMVLGAADLVWIGYRHHVYMSGVLVLAGKAGLPLVGSPEGEIGHLISKHGLGAVVNVDRPDEVAKALLSLFDAEVRQRAGERAAQAFADHTVENFGTRVLDSLATSP